MAVNQRSSFYFTKMAGAMQLGVNSVKSVTPGIGATF